MVVISRRVFAKMASYTGTTFFLFVQGAIGDDLLLLLWNIIFINDLKQNISPLVSVSP